MPSEAYEPLTLACIFDCHKKEELKVISAQRFSGIIKASKVLNDNLHKTLSHADQPNSVQLYCHRVCVLLYTSKEHIKHSLKQKETIEETVNPGLAKRTHSLLITCLTSRSIVYSVAQNVLKKIPKTLLDAGFIIK